MDKRLLEAMATYTEAQANALDDLNAVLAELLTEAEAEEAPAPAKKTAAAKKAPPSVAAKKTAAPPAKKAAPAKKAIAKAEPEPDEEDADDPRLTQLQAMKLPALRALAIKKGFKAPEVKAETDTDVLAQAIYDDEVAMAAADDDADDEADAVEEDTVEAETVQYSRADLKDTNLRDLRRMAAEVGVSAADMRGKDAESIIDLMLGEEDAEDEDGEEEPLTEADLLAMSPAELKKYCKDWGVTVTRGMTVKQMVAALLAAAEAADDEE